MNKPLAKDSATPASAVSANWEDPFDLESQLTDDERMARDTADSAWLAMARRLSLSRVISSE